ncbi:MAG: hypothetical protein SNJ59_13220 [Aggregatilineales bacterium]
MRSNAKGRQDGFTMGGWHCTFLPYEDHSAIASALRSALTALGYALFDPFSMMPGRTYPLAVRLFVAPNADGWTRVLGQLDDPPRKDVLTALSDIAPVLYTGLQDERAFLFAYKNVQSVEVDTAFANYLRMGLTSDDLRQALQEQPAPATIDKDVTAAALSTLPPNIEALSEARGVDRRQAAQLFERMSRGALARSGAQGQEAAARALVTGGAVNWSSASGRWLRRALEHLTIPTGWAQPDFISLRDAYQLHLRRQRRPNAPLYPGDAETMAAVENALEYLPVYAGKEA